jgi:hypothetical protein
VRAGDSGGDERFLSSSPSVVGPTVPTVTATFSGVLSPNGLEFHPFETTQVGKVTMTITPTAPNGAPLTARVGVGLGILLSVAPFCGIVDGVAAGIGRSTRFESIANSGLSCAAVYDIGELTETVSYTMTVVHPL